MKYTALITGLIATLPGFAQQRMEYANFIQTDTAVKWAAVHSSYLNVTVANPNFDINRFYASKFKKGDVAVYSEDAAGFAVNKMFLGNAEFRKIKRSFYYDAQKMNWMFYFDDRNDASEQVFRNEGNHCDTCFGKNRISFIKVKQLLYYKNDRLYIQNLWLSPVVFTKNSGEGKEESRFTESMNVGFNAAGNDATTIPATARYIGRACNNLVLLPPDGTSESQVLTLQDWSLSALLNRRIKAGALQVYNTDSSLYPDKQFVADPSSIKKLRLPPLPVQVYSENGDVESVKMMEPEINYDSLYNYTLVQDLYFDFTKEKLYSRVIALAPRMKVETSAGVYLGLSNYWGIFFPPEKKKTVRKRK